MKTIPLTIHRPTRFNLRSRGKVALVDDEDYEKAMQYPWHAFMAKRGVTWYAKSGRLFLHRLVMGATYRDGKEIDHKDNDGLNCQKHNLRFASSSQNKVNTPPRGRSGIKGVRFHQGKWEVAVRPGGNQRQRYLGRFDTAKEAADAYDKAALEAHGEFARLNNI